MIHVRHFIVNGGLRPRQGAYEVVVAVFFRLEPGPNLDGLPVDPGRTIFPGSNIYYPHERDTRTPFNPNIL
jgi:hypothetical protein